MTDFVTRANYENKKYEVIINTDNEEHYKLAETFSRALIDNRKTADITKCRECRYWEFKCTGDFDFTYGVCLFWQIEKCQDFYPETVGDHFCSYGERK